MKEVAAILNNTGTYDHDPKWKKDMEGQPLGQHIYFPLAPAA